MSKGFYLGDDPTEVNNYRAVDLSSWNTKNVKYKFGFPSKEGIKFSDWSMGKIIEVKTSEGKLTSFYIEGFEHHKFSSSNYQLPSPHYPLGLFVNGNVYLVFEDENENS